MQNVSPHLGNMAESTIMIKGWTTLPKQIRQAVNLGPGYRLRYVVLDDGQVRLMSSRPVAELAWVLERTYRLSRHDIAVPIDGVRTAQELVVEAADRVGLANERYLLGGSGFSEQMIGLFGRDVGCRATVSFDRQAGMVPPTT